MLFPCVFPELLCASFMQLSCIIAFLFPMHPLPYWVLLLCVSPALLFTLSLCIPCIIACSFPAYPLHHCVIIACISPAPSLAPFNFYVPSPVSSSTPASSSVPSTAPCPHPTAQLLSPCAPAVGKNASRIIQQALQGCSLSSNISEISI